jgi:hypothetical protein
VAFDLAYNKYVKTNTVHHLSEAFKVHDIMYSPLLILV